MLKPDPKLLFLALLWPVLLHAQYDPEAKVDPLGRPYRPVVGVLEPIVRPDVPKDIANYLAIAFSNGAKGNAYTPYGVVNKPKLEQAVKIYPWLDSTERKRARYQGYYGESVGTEYMLQLEILHYSCIVSIDTPPGPYPVGRRVFNFYADMTARLTDVTTSKVLSVKHFNVQSDTRSMGNLPNGSDSLLALQQLYTATHDEAPLMLNRLITGIGQIVDIRQNEKDKAETVLLSNSPITLVGKYESLPVFVLNETFETPMGTYLYSERVGTIFKTNDYNYKERNFKVTRGGKDMADLFKSGKLLVVSKGSDLPPRRPTPTDGRRSVLAEAFANKTAAADFQVRILEDVLTEYLTTKPQLIDIVDRKMYALLEAERKMQSFNQSDASQGGATVGAEYLLAADVTQLDFRRDVIKKSKEKEPAPANAGNQATPQKPAPTSTTPSSTRPGAASSTPPAQTQKEKEKQPAVAKPTIRFVETINAGTKVTANAAVDVRLVKIQTGEIVWNSTIKAGAMKDFLYDQVPKTEASRDEEVIQLLAANFAASAGPVVYRNLRPPTPVLKIMEVSKDKAKTVLIGGGLLAGNFDAQQFEVVEVTEEMVDGQALKRETVIAKIKADLIYPETTLCKVKSGEQELLARFNAKSNLYCRVAY